MTLNNAADKAYTITKNQANFLTNWTYSGSTQSALANVLATANTAFVYDKTSGYTAYTGISGVPSYVAKDDNEVIAYLCDSNGYAIFVVAYGGDKDNTAAAVDYVFTTGAGVETYVSASESYWTFPAVVNGEITTIEATAAAGTSGLTTGDLKSVATYDGKRVATTNQAGSRILDMNGSTGGIALGSIDDIVVSGYSVKFMNNGVMQGSAIVTGDTKYFLFDTTNDDSITQITVDEMDALTGGTYSIQAVKKSSTDSTVTEMFITKTANTDVTMSTTIATAAAPGTILDTKTATGSYTAAASTAYVLNVTADPNAVITYTVNGGASTTTTGLINVSSGASPSSTAVAITVTNNGNTATYTITLSVS